MASTLTWARRYLKPPCGPQVRRLIAWMTLAAGFPRLPAFDDLQLYAPLRLFEPQFFGVTLTVLGLALLVTSYRWRLRLAGRLTAVFGFVAWMTLAAATVSVTSFLINIAVAVSLLTEVWTVGEC